MKKILILCFVMCSIIGFSQKASVEKSIYGVELGLLDFSFHNETRLQRTIALRSEIGFNKLYSTIKSYNPAVKDKTVSFISPYISLEPRWYFGIDRRAKLGRNIVKNSSNYISLKTLYISANTPIVNTSDINFKPLIIVVPEFGIRRNFLKHFNYEFSGGLGYMYSISNCNKGNKCNRQDSFLDLNTRIGYVF